MTPPGTLIRIMKASPPWRWGYIPTHLKRSSSPGTLLMESAPCFEYVSMIGLGDLEGVPRQLQLLNRVELADVAVGPDELEPAVATAAELHPVGIVEVTRH